MSGEVVLAVYRPKPGRENDLLAVVGEHVPSLRAWGFATERPVLLLRAADGTLLEIFEWLPGAAERAHHDPRVGALWERFAAVADFLAPAQLPGADRPFPHFRAVDGVTV